MASSNRLLFPQRNVQVVRNEKRSRKKIILRAVAVNFLVFIYYYGYTQTTFQDDFIDFIPPYINIRSDLFIAPKYGILSCGIRKSMSQLLINIMCLLHNENLFLSQERSLNDTWMSQRVCSHKDTRFHIPQSTANSLQMNLTKFAFIRDPFDRFISFYLHICQNENGCWDCRGDMRCVVKNVYGSLRKYEMDPDERKSTLVDRHAAPISWNCNFQDQLSSYHLIKIGADFVKRQAAITELSGILSENDIPENLLKKISIESMTGETLHGTHKSEGRLKAEEQVKRDTVVREYLHKIYFFDYLIFKFNSIHLDKQYQDLLVFWNKFG